MIALPRLGRIRPQPHAKRLRLMAYMKAPLPPAPAAWDGASGLSFPLLGNDRYGDCTAVALAHLLMLQAHAEGRTLSFEEQSIVGFYLAGTGGQDAGAVETDVLLRVAASGFAADGANHIAAWASLVAQDQDQVRAAAALFRGLYVGAELPLAAQRDGLWEAVDGSVGEPGSWGGHAMALVAYDADGPTFATWGRLQKATWGWWARYVDEAHVVLDAGRQASALAVDWQALLADAAALGRSA